MQIKRHLPADNATHSIRTSISKMWDTIEALAKSQPATQISTSQVGSASGGGGRGLAGGTGNPGPYGSPYSRTDVSVTTGSIASGAVTNIEIDLAKSSEIYTVTTDHPAEIRMYSTSAARTTDSSRPSTTAPIAGKGFICQNTTTLSDLAINQSPVPKFVNHDLPVGTTAYLSVKNMGGAPAAITVTISHVRQE